MTLDIRLSVSLEEVSDLWFMLLYFTLLPNATTQYILAAALKKYIVSDCFLSYSVIFFDMLFSLRHTIIEID